MSVSREYSAHLCNDTSLVHTQSCKQIHLIEMWDMKYMYCKIHKLQYMYCKIHKLQYMYCKIHKLQYMYCKIHKLQYMYCKIHKLQSENKAIYFNLITVQHDVTYSVYYISVGS